MVADTQHFQNNKQLDFLVWKDLIFFFRSNLHMCSLRQYILEQTRLTILQSRSWWMLSLHGTTSTDHKLSYARSVPGMLKIRRDGDKKTGG
jgi:hypothetical protein